jgi:hypothetical protein
VPNEYFHEMARVLIQAADEALYQAKRRGGHQMYEGAAVEWLPPGSMAEPPHTPQPPTPDSGQ